MSSVDVSKLRTQFPHILENELMAKHTSLRIGGPAQLFLQVQSIDELKEAIHTAKEHAISWFVFGGGSNLLVADEGFSGLVIQMGTRKLLIQENGLVEAESGVITSLVARRSVDVGFTGLEWAVGVPGTIGGAVYGNAGCYGGETKDLLQWVTILEPKTGEIRRLSCEECKFGYRTSLFKEKDWLILSVSFQLERAKDSQISQQELQRIMMTRKEKQPLQQSSAGCAFTNVRCSIEQLNQLERRVGLVPENMRTSGVVSSGWLIDRLGLLGFTQGNVKVSEKHGNFLVNTQSATAKEVYTLIKTVQSRVLVETGLTLSPEVQLLGFKTG